MEGSLAVLGGARIHSHIYVDDRITVKTVLVAKIQVLDPPCLRRSHKVDGMSILHT